MNRNRVLAVLAVAVWVVGCSGNTPAGTTCPTGDPPGPTIGAAGGVLVANSLEETWVGWRSGTIALLPQRGLLGRAPNHLAVHGDRLYAVNSLDNTIQIIDLTTGTTRGCIDLGPGVNPWEFQVDPYVVDRGWVTGFVSGELLEVDLDRETVLRRVTVAAGVEGIWITPTQIAVTLTGFGGNKGQFGPGAVVVMARDSLTVVHRVALPPNAQSFVAGHAGEVHVICTGDYNQIGGSVVRLHSDLSAARDTLVVGGAPARGINVDGVVFLAAFYGGLMAYDAIGFTLLHGPQNPIEASSGYTDVAAMGDRVYAANFDLDAVAVVDPATRSVVGDLLVGDGPVALAVVPARP